MFSSNDHGNGAPQHEGTRNDLEEKLNLAFSEAYNWDGQSVRELYPTLTCIARIAKSPCFHPQERDEILQRTVNVIYEGQPSAGDWPKYVHEFHLESGTYGPCNRSDVAFYPPNQLVWVAVDVNGNFVVANMNDQGFQFEISRFSNYEGKRWMLARRVHRHCDVCYDGDLSVMAEDLGLPVSELANIAQGSGFQYPDLFALALVGLAVCEL
jgi:hypothetical protein